MAKRLVLNVLEEFLGDYVNGLTSDNLKFGVWGGKIEFNNLEIKAQTFSQFDMPLAVSKGSIKHIKIQIPWTSLGKSPINVSVDGLLLLLRPMEEHEFRGNTAMKEKSMAARQRVFQTELRKIIEKLLVIGLREDANSGINVFVKSVLAGRHSKQLANIGQSSTERKSKSYLQKLVTKIIDTLEISIRNIHVRYEDHNAIPDHVFSVGVTLSHFVVTQPDDIGSGGVALTKTVEKKEKRDYTVVRKMLMVSNLCVYCHASESISLSQINPLSVWVDCMLGMVHDERNPEGTDISAIEYLLSPPNNLTINFCHNEIVSETQPKIRVELQGKLSFRLEKLQLQYLVTAANRLTKLALLQRIKGFRPEVSIKVNPRAWWQYAYRRVTRRYVGELRRNSEVIESCYSCRNRYKDLYKVYLLGSAMADEDLQEMR